MAETVIIHTDGACSGNPGPGGWGAVLQFNGHVKELKGGEALTTNNKMELTAAIEALNALKRPCDGGAAYRQQLREGRHHQAGFMAGRRMAGGPPTRSR